MNSEQNQNEENGAETETQQDQGITNPSTIDPSNSQEINNHIPSEISQNEANLQADDNIEIQLGEEEEEEEIEEAQSNQNEENTNANAENDQGDSGLVNNLISSVSNAHLMSEENIEAIREVLCKKENVFYKLSQRDKNLEEELITIIKWKAKIAEATIGQALNYYHQKLLDSELNHLDKLMKILKNNKREMYLRRLTHDYFDSATGDSNSPKNDDPFERHLRMSEQAQGEKKVSLRDLLPEYDSQKRFIRFKLNEKYEVYLKAFEEKSTRKPSLIDKIPIDVLQNHIFIYFNSFDLFKLRAVCTEWRELIRGMWHIIFRREMMEQVIAADLCNDIEMNFKLMSVKSPFYQKFGIFMKAISEIIDWDTFLPSLLTDTVDTRVKMLVVTFFKMIGMEVGFNKLSDFHEAYWQHFKDIGSNHLKTFIDSLFHHEFQFKSNYELDLVKENFLDCPDISSFSIRQLDDKNAVMLQLFLRQLLVFAQLKNYISIAQSYIILAKDKLKEVSREWPHKKDFLEGAYKILLFKFIEIKDGEVSIVKEDHDRKSGLLRNIQTELDECMNITSRIQNDEPLPQDSEVVQNVQDTAQEKLEKQEEVQTSQNPTEEVILGALMEKDLKQQIEESISEEQKKIELAATATSEEKQNEELKNDIPNEQNTEEEIPCSFAKSECELNKQLAKIIQMKANSSPEVSFQNFLHSRDPDYVINKNGSQTRLYLDDLIKIEFLIQKVIKQHLQNQTNTCDCPLHRAIDQEEEELEEIEEQQEEEATEEVTEENVNHHPENTNTNDNEIL